MRDLFSNQAFAKQYSLPGGIKFAGKTIIPGEKFEWLANVTGATRVKEILADTRAFQAVRGWFSRGPHGVPAGQAETYKEAVRAVESRVYNLTNESLDLIKGAAKKLKPEELDDLTTQMATLDDQTGQLFKDLKAANDKEYLAESAKLRGTLSKGRAQYRRDLVSDEDKLQMYTNLRQ